MSSLPSNTLEIIDALIDAAGRGEAEENLYDSDGWIAMPWAVVEQLRETIRLMLDPD